MRRNGAIRGTGKVAKQGANTRPVPEAQSLALTTETPAAPSRSNKKPPETSTEITGIHCYLGNGISMYGILHMAQRDRGPELQFILDRGREGSWLPSRLSKTDWWDGVSPRWFLLHAKGMASTSGHGKCPAAGTALHFATWFYPGGGQNPMLMREKAIATAFAVKKGNLKECVTFANWWVTSLVLCLET